MNRRGGYNRDSRAAERDGDENNKSNEEEKSPQPHPEPLKKSPIFGDAKPVDTIKKEREIEAKLKTMEVNDDVKKERPRSGCSNIHPENPSKRGFLAKSQSQIIAAKAASLHTFSLRNPCEIKLGDLQNIPLKKGDEIIFERMGISSNYWIVSNPNELKMYENDLAKEMKKVEMFAKPVISSALVKDQIIAARWSEDKKMYRAIINEIDKEFGKVKVRFIDYGNHSFEPFGHLFQLSNMASKYPILAKIINLEAVPAVPKTFEIEQRYIYQFTFFEIFRRLPIIDW